MTRSAMPQTMWYGEGVRRQFTWHWTDHLHAADLLDWFERGTYEWDDTDE